MHFKIRIVGKTVPDFQVTVGTHCSRQNPGLKSQKLMKVGRTHENIPRSRCEREGGASGTTEVSPGHP